jgi:hypothetical protein
MSATGVTSSATDLVTSVVTIRRDERQRSGAVVVGRGREGGVASAVLSAGTVPENVIVVSAVPVSDREAQTEIVLIDSVP